MDIRPILNVVGVLLCILAAAMLLPALVDFLDKDRDAQAFIASTIITAFAGAILWLTNRGQRQKEIRLRQAFLLTAASWIVVTAFACLPLVFGASHLGYVDAYFETMSGMTTTGSTVMTGLDALPAGLLLWRAILQWLGGVGIIVMGLALLPQMRVGGMQLFRSESSDRSAKLLPSTGALAAAISSVYAGLTAACTLAYAMGGMSLFDAVCHAMATLSTGGFSTHDASFAYFDSAYLHMVAVVFMILGSLPFSLYIAFTHRREMVSLLLDDQVRYFLLICVASALVLTAYLAIEKDYDVLVAFRHSLFNAVSVITTTGFASTDYGVWGSFAAVIFFALYFVGGCTGSTAGSIKIFRHQILFLAIRRVLFRMTSPHAIYKTQINGMPVTEDVQTSVLAFVFVFAATVIIAAAGLAACGLDLVTALSSAATAVSNVGPGLGDIAGPSGNFASFSDPAKIIMALSMLLGRLELFTILVLMTPRFWRQ